MRAYAFLVVFVSVATSLTGAQTSPWRLVSLVGCVGTRVSFKAHPLRGRGHQSQERSGGVASILSSQLENMLKLT